MKPNTLSTPDTIFCKIKLFRGGNIGSSFGEDEERNCKKVRNRKN